MAARSRRCVRALWWATLTDGAAGGSRVEVADVVCPGCGAEGRWMEIDKFGELWGCFICSHLSEARGE